MHLNIEKLIYGGDGLARLAPDASGKGKAAFVPFVLAGEQVDAEIIEERPGFVRARADEIVHPSPERIEPQCPYFGRCGGCHYQHTNYTHQLEIKRDILIETIRRTAKVELPCELNVVSAEPWHFRNRTRLKMRTSPEFAVGYFRHASHELLPVRECPISSPLLNRAITALWELESAFIQYPEIREAQLFANHADTELMIELYVERAGDEEHYDQLSDTLEQAIPELVGITIFEYAPVRDGDEDRPPVAARSGAVHTFGAKSMEYEVGAHRYQVSAGSFFQTNRFLSEKLVSLVTAEYTGKIALDLFAGTGLFSLPLASRFSRVNAVEASPFSSADLRANSLGKEIRPIERDMGSYLESVTKPCELVIVDPPRAGLGERNARKLAQIRTPRIVYVSCDPSTLARDLRVLMESGFQINQANLVDLFPQTFHMESVFHLAR